jgi:hypothetical protein
VTEVALIAELMAQDNVSRSAIRNLISGPLISVFAENVLKQYPNIVDDVVDVDPKLMLTKLRNVFFQTVTQMLKVNKTFMMVMPQKDQFVPFKESYRDGFLCTRNYSEVNACVMKYIQLHCRKPFKEDVTLLLSVRVWTICFSFIVTYSLCMIMVTVIGQMLHAFSSTTSCATGTDIFHYWMSNRIPGSYFRNQVAMLSYYICIKKIGPIPPGSFADTFFMI